MPYIVTGEPSIPKTDYLREDHDYEYPHDLDLKPGSDFHDELRNKIWQRARESRNEMSNRFSSWNEIDKSLTTYMPTDDKEKTLKNKDARKPVSIVFPYSYSVLEALLTYMTMAFFQDPMFQYEGVDDDDVIGGMLLELVIKLHCIKNKVPLAVHTSLRDGFAYGIGVGLPGWVTKYGKVPIKSSVIRESELGESTEDLVNYVDGIVFEGNDLSNIDPYLWLPDPGVASHEVQKGEFVGWVDRSNYMNMLSEEAEPDSGIFNVKYLKERKDKRSSLSTDESERQKKSGGSTHQRRGLTDSTNPVDNINMYVKLIPKDWKLGGGEYPEKWFFRLSADDVITICERVESHHNMFPVAVASPEYDGYSITPIGRMEIIRGLQGVLDFMFNSHVTNVRKAINDMFIVDPYLVNINDLKDPQPGKLIRLRRPAWGRGVDKVVQQLAVQDITRANVSDAGYITQLMDRISGADQSMQGSLRTGGPERLTRSEFQGTRGSAIGRLQRLAMIIGMQYMQDIGTMFAFHTQEHMSKEAYVKIAGRHEQELLKQFDKKRVRVGPHDIAINYDLIVRDGSIPGGNFSESWVSLFSTIVKVPELYKEFDIFRLFSYIATQMGAKNVEDFRRNVSNINTQVLPDEQVAGQVQQGNLVPTES